MIRFETSVGVARPPDDVFAVVADPETYPRWNSAVRAVRPLPGDPTRYRMERDLPSGPAENLVEVVSASRPDEVVIRAGEGPTPFLYRYRLRAANGGTHLELEADVDLGAFAALLGPVAGRAVKRGVDDNFAALKRLLERD